MQNSKRKSKKGVTMKICIISSAYPPIIGGTELATYNIAKKIAKKGIKVYVLTSKAKVAPSYEKNKNLDSQIADIDSENNNKLWKVRELEQKKVYLENDLWEYEMAEKER